MMQGQISIDYLAGAMIFFGALILLVSNVMTTLPSFSEAQRVDELQLSAWSASEVLVNDQGYWDDGATNGTEWQDHPEDVRIAGLESSDGDLSMEKIQALLDLDGEELQDALAVNRSTAVAFREIVSVDTHRTFEQGNEPSFITEPSYDSDAAITVHYGARTIHGDQVHLLLTNVTGFYDHLYVSRDWDFTNVNTETFNLTDTSYAQIGARTYTLAAGHTGISDGRTVIMTRDMGRTGPVPPEGVEDIVTADRYAMVDRSVVEVRIQTWP